VSSKERAEQLIRLNADDVLAYLERRVQPRDDAADLLAEVLLIAWRRRSICPADPRQGRMWLFTVARNLLANHRRGVSRRHALADRVRQQLAVAQPVAGPPDRDSPVADAVAALPDDLRELVTLVHWDGFSVTEAGELLGLNSSTARTRHAAAKSRLRRMLQPAPSSS
jgi:RNA polymerase sigma-70 factor (ECF subfamily)